MRVRSVCFRPDSGTIRSPYPIDSALNPFSLHPTGKHWLRGRARFMIQQTFQHRSGRVISLSRVVLSLAFPTGIWLDPTQPVRHEEMCYALLTGYLIVSIFFLLATWDDWLRETRLALPALVVDLGLFAALVFVTGGDSNPFFPMYVFIILSAALRWGWRETALTATILTVLFLSASAAAVALEESGFNPQRFVFRSAFLVVMSFVLVWFGLNQVRPRMARLTQGRPENLGETVLPPVREAMRFVVAHTDARRVIFVWRNRRDFHTTISALDEKDGFEEHQSDFGVLEALRHAELEGATFLFDMAHNTILRHEGRRRRFLTVPQIIETGFSRTFHLTRGLAIPMASSGYSGVMFAIDIPGLCSDDLSQGDSLGEEISAAFERTSMMALLQDAASTRIRLSLSRDLHDSVLQLLAGTSLRLEGVKKSARLGREIEAEIGALQRDLVVEQRDVRELINQLRCGDTANTMSDLRASLHELADRMSRQWDVECRLDQCPSELSTSHPFERDCHQLVREAVANAVRHGKASAIAIRVDNRSDAVQLVVSDNGSGFPGYGHFETDHNGKAPWSLSERVRTLGGQLSLVSDRSGSEITISLPLERVA